MDTETTKQLAELIRIVSGIRNLLLGIFVASWMVFIHMVSSKYMK